MTSCKAVQHSDQMVCECGQVWDMNDPNPPECEQVTPSFSEVVEALRLTTDCLTKALTGGEVRAKDAARALMAAGELLENYDKANREQHVKQEPVAWKVDGDGSLSLYGSYPKWAEGGTELRITPLYTAPPAVPDVSGLIGVMECLVDHIESNTCLHENTHRGGVLWEICDDCGEKWADDRGGRPEFEWSDCVEQARSLISAHREQQTAPVSAPDVSGLVIALERALDFIQSDGDSFHQETLERCECYACVTDEIIESLSAFREHQS